MQFFFFHYKDEGTQINTYETETEISDYSRLGWALFNHLFGQKKHKYKK